MAVEHRQQGQADTGGAGGLADAQGQFGRVRVGVAIDVMVHVMKFRNRGVAGLEHFDVQLTGNHAKLFGADFSDEAIHQVAPGPEAVVRITRHFRQPGHRPLKGVGMQVGHAR
ncbi:hypothetical protein D3C73_1047930 [compost metagenome]